MTDALAPPCQPHLQERQRGGRSRGLEEIDRSFLAKRPALHREALQRRVLSQQAGKVAGPFVAQQQAGTVDLRDGLSSVQNLVNHLSNESR